MSIEEQARAAVDQAAGAHAAPQQEAPMPQELTRWGRIHRDMTGMGHALLDMARLSARIKADPQLEAAVETLMAMAGLGAEAHEFQAIIDLGQAVVARRQAAPAGTGAQPAFTPADGVGGMAQPDGA